MVIIVRLQEHNADLLAVAFNGVDPSSHTMLAGAMAARFASNADGPAFIGAMPRQPLLEQISLNEVQAALQVPLRWWDCSILLSQGIDACHICALGKEMRRNYLQAACYERIQRTFEHG